MKKYKYTKDFNINGKRYKIRADTLEELYEKKLKKMREVESGLVTNAITVEDWVKVSMKTYKVNISESTREQMELRINKHILPVIGHMKLSAVTPLMCQQIISSQASMSFSHIQKLTQELRFIFETAKKNNLILKNPAAYLEVPRGTKGKRRAITAEEREHLLKVAEEYPPFILYKLILYCGCRPGEAIGCVGSDIVLSGDTPMLHIRGTKTVNSDRLVPIPAYFYPEIEGTAPDAPLAPNSSGRKHTESSYNRLFARLKREMNISMGCKVYRNKLIEPFPLADDFVPYNLRHTYCTDLCRMGIDVRVAQKLMGHSSIKITADIYTHVETGDLENVAKILDKGVLRVSQGCRI